MRKRLFSLLVATLLLVVGGCDASFLSSAPQNALSERDPKQFISEFQESWQYATLSSTDKVYYGHLYTAVKEAEKQDSVIHITDETGAESTIHGVRVTLPNASLSKERMTALFEVFFRDNPQFFYLSRTYHLEGHNSSNSETITYDTLILQFTMSLEQRNTAIQQFEQVTKSILDDCPNDQDEYGKELYLHDSLATRCTYDQDAAVLTGDTESSAYTAYGALVEGKAVCEGYAKAMQWLLKRANIKATVITGNSLKTGEPHMWNLVKINAEVYHLDPTWDDSDTYLQHTYLNLSSDMIAASHKIDEKQPAATSCTATKDNYFVRNNAYIDTYERQTIAEAIAQQVLEGNQIVQLKFSKGKLANGQLFLKNRTLVCQKVNPYLSEKGLSLWEYQLWIDEEQQVLTLVKE